MHGETTGKAEGPWSAMEEWRHEKEEHGGDRKQPKEKR